MRITKNIKMTRFKLLRDLKNVDDGTQNIDKSTQSPRSTVEFMDILLVCQKLYVINRNNREQPAENK